MLLAAYACCPVSVAVATCDPLADRLIGVRRLPGVVVAHARTVSGLALLLGPATTIGPAQLALAEPDRLRVVALPTVSAGRETVDRLPVQRPPALAVDPAEGRAYVFPPSGGAVEVKLATGIIRTHALARRTLAKGAGPTRAALWLGNGLVALTGMDEHLSRRGSSFDYRLDPAGLAIVDVGRWTTRVASRDASGAILAGGLFVATDRSHPARPLRVYDAGGRLRLTLDGVTTNQLVQAAGNRVYAGNRLIEVTSGRLLAQIAPKPRLILLQTD